MNLYYLKYLKYKQKYKKIKLSKNDIEKKGFEFVKKILDENLTNTSLIKENNRYYIKDDNNKIELTWDNYKKYTKLETKKEINKLRNKIVDGLIEFIFNTYEPCINICKFTPSGSTGTYATLD